MKPLAAAVLLALASAAPADTLIVLNKFDDTASVIDAGTRETLRTVPTGNAPHEAAVAPDGRTVVVGDYGDRAERGRTLTVFDLTSNDPPRTIDLERYHRPHGIEFIDADRVVVTAETERKLLVVNIRTGTVERALDTTQNLSHMVALSADKRYAVTANIGDGTATVIDLETDAGPVVIETGAGAEGVAARPGTSEVWIANRSADTLSVIDLDGMKVVEQIDCGVFPIRIKFTPDGGRALVSCAESGDVAVIDAEQRSIAGRVSMQARTVKEHKERLFGDRFGKSPVPIGILIEPSGDRAYIANTNADVVTVIDLRELEIEDRLTAGAEPDGLAWSPLDLAD